MKKRGFGVGKWNGIGGKIEPGETVEQALTRECQEEIEVTPQAARKVGVLECAFGGDTPDQKVHVFVCNDWHGEPTETEEMAPQWYTQGALPYADMWADDEYWLPQVVAGKLVRGSFEFDSDLRLTGHDVRVVDALEDVR